MLPQALPQPQRVPQTQPAQRLPTAEELQPEKTTLPAQEKKIHLQATKTTKKSQEIR